MFESCGCLTVYKSVTVPYSSDNVSPPLFARGLVCRLVVREGQQAQIIIFSGLQTQRNISTNDLCVWIRFLCNLVAAEAKKQTCCLFVLEALSQQEQSCCPGAVNLG